jgi:hypothetical protein
LSGRSGLARDVLSLCRPPDVRRNRPLGSPAKETAVTTTTIRLFFGRQHRVFQTCQPPREMLTDHRLDLGLCGVFGTATL